MTIKYDPNKCVLPNPPNAERIDRMLKSVFDALGRGNNVEIKLRSNGVIAVMELKTNTTNI